MPIASNAMAHATPDSNDVVRGTVEVGLIFIAPPVDGSTPHLDTTVPSGDEENGLNAKESHQVRLTDIRSHESQFTLDRNAFRAIGNVPSATTYETFNSESEIRRVYYPEVENLLLDHVANAHRVIILGHGVRREKADGQRQPIRFVHVDHSSQAAEDLVRENTESEELQNALEGRYRILSIWRPLNGTVKSMPMAFTSGDSLDGQDLSPVEMRYADRTSSFTGLKHNPRQQWHYWSGMQNNERLLLMCTDTGSGKAMKAAHSAWIHPTATSASKPRESIEVRALVFG